MDGGNFDDTHFSPFFSTVTEHENNSQKQNFTVKDDPQTPPREAAEIEKHAGQGKSQ